MTHLHMKAAYAGLAFGIWPLLLNVSRLPPNVSGAVYTVFVLLFTMPFAFPYVSSIQNVNWPIVVGAGAIGASGLVAFNNMLAHAPQAQVSNFFVIMVVVQISVPALYSVVLSAGAHPIRIAGFVFAALAAVLLTIDV